MRKKLLLALITERVIFVVILSLFFLQYFDLTEFFFSGDTVIWDAFMNRLFIQDKRDKYNALCYKDGENGDLKFF